jgi:hypothetical protein
MIDDNETVSALTLQRGTRTVLNATIAGRHVNITRHRTVEAVLVPLDWYLRAQELMAATGSDD